MGVRRLRVQFTDAHTGIVNVTYVYNTGKAMGMLQMMYGRSNQFAWERANV